MAVTGPKTDQDLTVRRGEDWPVVFRVAGGAGASAVAWRVGLTRRATARLVNMRSDATELEFEDDGTDLVVSLRLDAGQSEALPVATLFHELWVVKGGDDRCVAEGKLFCLDSLKTVA